jgi:Zn ribbon nucleic-acid-binding protein
MPIELTHCPQCSSQLSNYEQKERECFSCGWSEHEGLNDTRKNVPPDFEYDREIDDETMD